VALSDGHDLAAVSACIRVRVAETGTVVLHVRGRQSDGTLNFLPECMSSCWKPVQVAGDFEDG